MDIIEIFTAPVIVESTTTSTQVVEVEAVAPVIEIFTTPVILETTTTPSQIVEVVTEGPQGPPGYGGDINFVHFQNTPQSQWVIVHNLGKFPSVSVVDSAQTHVEGGVHYDSVNQLTLSFASGFSGKAILN